jgi:hypothetical protein
MEIGTTKNEMYQGDQDKERSPMGYVSNKGVSERGMVPSIEKKD